MGGVGGGGPTLLEWASGEIVMARRVPRVFPCLHVRTYVPA